MIAALAAALLVALVYAHHLGEGDRALAEGDPAAALAAYSVAAAAAPWDPAPLDRAAQAAMAAGRYADAERSLRQLAGRAGWTADLHRRLGDALHARGEAGAAVAAWEAALSADPENTGALRALAGAAIQARDWEQATLLLQRLVAAAPDDAAARYHLGLLLAPYLPEQAAPHL
ncbi:MAG: tetratricopeptide repeat protein [Anaerolineae bacterium]|nr:tetratricopeptide repeat protein [Anaerolineae bacterium]